MVAVYCDKIFLDSVIYYQNSGSCFITAVLSLIANRYTYAVLSTVCYFLAPTDRLVTGICYRSASIRLVQSLPLVALTDSKALWTKRLYSTYLPLFTCEISSMIEVDNAIPTYRSYTGSSCEPTECTYHRKANMPPTKQRTQTPLDRYTLDLYTKIITHTLPPYMYMMYA